MGPFVYDGRGIQIGAFSNSLGAMIRETVVDDTGLTGWWDLKVEGNLTGVGDAHAARWHNDREAFGLHGGAGAARIEVRAAARAGRDVRDRFSPTSDE
jgi:uncharacterized protein (TIGR03435 family)